MYDESDHVECERTLNHYQTLCNTAAAKNKALMASQGCIAKMEESFRATVAELEEMIRRQAHNDTEIGKLEYNAEDSEAMCHQKKSSLNLEQTKHESIRTQLQDKDRDCHNLREQLAKSKQQNMVLDVQLKTTHTQIEVLGVQHEKEVLEKEKILAILLHKEMELFSRQEEEQTLKKEGEAHAQNSQKFRDKLLRSFVKMVKDPPEEKISLLSSKGICKFYHDGSESDCSEAEHCADDSDDSSDEESKLAAATAVETALSPVIDSPSQHLPSFCSQPAAAAAATEAIRCSDGDSVESDNVNVLEYDSQQDLLSAFRNPKYSESAVTESAVASGGRVGSDAEKCLKQVTQFHDKLRRHYKFGELEHPLARGQLLTSQSEAIRSQMNALKHDFKRMWATQKMHRYG